MSADSRSTCPACYQLAVPEIPFVEVTVDHLNFPPEEVRDAGLAEYFESYISGGHVIFEYHGAECSDCGYSIPGFTMKHPIPGP